MGNSHPQSDVLGEYVHRLIVEELPSFSHHRSSSFASTYAAEYGINNKNAFLSPKEPVGYLCIASSFKIPVYEKPHPRHLHNMKKTFGWTWEKNV